MSAFNKYIHLVNDYSEEKSEYNYKDLDSFKALLRDGFTIVPVIKKFDVLNERDRRVDPGKPIVRIQHKSSRVQMKTSNFVFSESYQFTTNGFIMEISENNEDTDIFGTYLNRHMKPTPISTIEELDAMFKHFFRWSRGKLYRVTSVDKPRNIETNFELDDIKKLKSFGTMLRMGFRFASTPQQLKNKTIVFQHTSDKSNTLAKRTFTITKAGYVSEVIKYNNPEFSSPTPRVLNQRDRTFGLAVQTIEDLDECIKFLVGYLEKYPERISYTKQMAIE